MTWLRYTRSVLFYMRTIQNNYVWCNEAMKLVDGGFVLSYFSVKGIQVMQNGYCTLIYIVDRGPQKSILNKYKTFLLVNNYVAEPIEYFLNFMKDKLDG